MKLIHLFWHSSNSDFNNLGKLYLWIEHKNKITTPDFYPYQLASDCFIDFVSKELKLSSSFEETEVSLPCNVKGEAVVSPIIANLNNLEDNLGVNYQSFILDAIEVDDPISFLKELNFKSYHFEDDMCLAGDAKFWIKMAYELSHVIKQDQYIPALIAQKKSINTQYHPKWQIISSQYQDRLKMIAEHMPLSGCLGDFSHFDPFSALVHFSDVILNTLVSLTPHTQKTFKSVEHSLIQPLLNHERLSIDAHTYKQWRSWKNNLEYDQFGADFQLCFKLHQADPHEQADWGLELLLQSKQDPSFMINLAQYWQEKVTKASLFEEMLGTSIDRILLLQLGYASRIYALLEQVFEHKMCREILTISHHQAFQFLKEDAWTLNACGFRIIVPAWWTASGRLKAKIKLKANKTSPTKSSSPTSHMTADNLIQFDYHYAMGEHQLTAEQWHQLLESKSELVYFRGNWIEIDKAEMQKMHKLIETSKQDMGSGSIQSLLTLAADEALYDVELDDQTQAMLDGLNRKDKFNLIEQPQQLNATLRPYQNRGLSWLAYLENLGMNPCLADDMGLGKTMQIIALLLSKPRDTAALLIAPTSVIGNWLKELTKFAPSINAVIHHGHKRRQKDFALVAEQHDLVITSYGLIHRDHALFKDIHWSRLIIDEAQNIKNPSAKQTKIIYGLKADSRIALTGTPIENRLMDLWSIFNFLNPGLLGKQAGFRKQFELPIQRDNNRYQSGILKNIVEPFILRRLKTDKSIINDLPEKIEQKVYCELSTEQASIYQSIVDEITQQIDNTQQDESKQKLIMLSALLRLKQCCNHPAQVLQDGSDFSIERSIKLQRLVDTAKEAIYNGESLLIFSQFTEVCGKLEILLKNQLGLQTYYIHGSTSRTRREQMIEEFQHEDNPPSIFILSLKAGGVGITLTKANHVIHFDRWWNPAVENQATDRAYRIGQKKTVFAHKFITLGTIEEKIDQMLEDKQKVADAIVGNDESWLSKLDANAFIKLIQLSSSN
ncbi:DEAD/DEAH box helicase [uncultured Shewanella sp.]|uniref:DEAD/DEAH box helicase n=1 Tax=uncultured Shewanella sp. TaxID=173975 RepID=UPI00260E1DAF|nr:DEAD/DEAH box helicase [uncultured Shewanella sp.]